MKMCFPVPTAIEDSSLDQDLEWTRFLVFMNHVINIINNDHVINIMSIIIIGMIIMISIIIKIGFKCKCLNMI